MAEKAQRTAESPGMLPQRWHDRQLTNRLVFWHSRAFPAMDSADGRGAKESGREGLVLRYKQRGLAIGRTSCMARAGDAVLLQGVSLWGQGQSSIRNMARRDWRERR